MQRPCWDTASVRTLGDRIVLDAGTTMGPPAGRAGEEGGMNTEVGHSTLPVNTALAERHIGLMIEKIAGHYDHALGTCSHLVRPCSVPPQAKTVTGVGP